MHDVGRDQKTRLGNEVAGRFGATEGAPTPGKRTQPNGLGQGKPLPAGLQRKFEGSLGVGLDDVRVHDDPEAAAAAKDKQARAFATGQDIAFGEGQYNPDSTEGEQLLAEEVAHTAQQKDAPPKDDPKTTTPGGTVENEAQQAASAMMAGEPAKVTVQSEKEIARNDEKKKAPSSAGGWLGKKRPGLELKREGGVSHRVQGTNVVFDGPKMTLETEVSVENGLPIDEMGKLEVGTIQNVLSSKRLAKYRIAEGGPVVAEFRCDLGSGVIDQRPLADDPAPQWSAWGRKPPWYQPPAVLDAMVPTGTVHYMDHPGFTIPQRCGGGFLSEVEGSDNFITSIAARQNGGPVEHLQSKTWSIPWSVKLNMKDYSKGEHAKMADPEMAKKGVNPDILGGPTALDTAVEYFKFDTVDAAIAAGVDVLLGPRGLMAARGKDEKSYRNMFHAIRGLNPGWTVSLKCLDNTDFIRDTTVVQMKGNMNTKSETLKMDSGDLKSTFVRFLEIFDPEKWDGTGLTVTVTAGGRTFNALHVPNPPGAMETFQNAKWGNLDGGKWYQFAVTRSP